MTFTTARSIADAVGAMARGARPIAGGSDLVVSARHGTAELPSALVAIDRVRELATVVCGADGCRIGAVVTHDRLMRHRDIVDDYTALADASALVGSPATRNVGTIGGNIMNASPAMDTGAPLVVLGASVELRSTIGRRTIPIIELWSGPGSTTATPVELCTSVLLPARADRSGSAYVRLEYRRAMEIAVVGAAAAIELHPDGTIATATIALAAVAPTIVALAEVDVVGRRADDPAVGATVAAAASERAEPIADLRAGEDYRRHTVGVMAARAVAAAIRRAQGERLAVPVNRAVGIGAPA